MPFNYIIKNIFEVLKRKILIFDEVKQLIYINSLNSNRFELFQIQVNILAI